MQPEGGRTKREEPRAGNNTVRLNRYLSMCGVTSRRKADDLIMAGHVFVNGRKVTDFGIRIDPRTDRVRIDEREIAVVREHEYLLLNKTRDSITTLRDEKGRRTVMDFVHTRGRVFPIGRLDRNTTGVLLLTDDGDFANLLMHPRFRIPKTYRVRCSSAVTPQDLTRLRTGIRLKDGPARAVAAAVVPGSRAREIGITVNDGRNRQVRRMFEALGYEVKGLDRVAYGPVTCEGLPRGAIRRLSPREIRRLREMAEGAFRPKTISEPASS